MKYANMTLDWGDRPDFRQMLKEMAETGWDGCETRLGADWIGLPERAKAIEASTGCKIFCISTETAPPDPNHWFMNVLKRRIEYAEAIEAESVMFFPPPRPWSRTPTKSEFDNFAEAAEMLAEYGEQHGVTVSLHNHSGQLVETIAETEIILNQTSKLQLCLDCYHTHIFGDDFVETYRKWKDRVHFVHIHDGNGLKLMELGDGIIPVKESLEGIKALGYDGWISTHGGTGDRSPYEKSRVCREYLKSIGF